MELVKKLRIAQGGYGYSLGVKEWLQPVCGEAADEIERLRAAAEDALAGWMYIRRTHGDLYGVGWDRVQTKLAEALKQQ